MREIKFRGKNKKTNKWEYGDLLQAIAQKQVWIINTLTKQVIPESVGQYTGIKDDKGIEIYEGDIVQLSSMAPGAPEFGGRIEFMEGSWWITDNEDAIVLFTEIGGLEVLGNMTDK